jgi:hypothetical protein
MEIGLVRSFLWAKPPGYTNRARRQRQENFRRIFCPDHQRLSGKRFNRAFPIPDKNGGKIMAGKKS